MGGWCCLMGLKEDISRDISEIFKQSWNVREGHNFPSSVNMALESGVKIDATMLCADLTVSSKFVTDFEQRTAGKVVRIFLRCIVRLITTSGGAVTSFDSNKVIGIFLGDMRNTNAATCALKINYVITKMISPSLKEYFANAKESGFSISHCVGIDTGPVMAIRSGLQSTNDLIWIGRPPNLAIELSEIRTEPYHTYISEDAFFMLFEQAKFNPDNEKQLMWEENHYNYLGEPRKVYRSNWNWEP
jgi:adenylate cyclase